jgi:carboxyl-terminal processing protease
MRNFLVFFVLTLSLYVHAQPKYFDMSKNLELFANAYKELNHSYVDELDPNKLMRSAMDAMLGELDPFTNYISETDVESYRIQSEGRYAGFGANGRKIGDYMVITDIYEDSPALKAGLQVGDAILAVDGQSARGRSQEEVLQFLRGFPGTKANLTVRRPGTSKEIIISLERAEMESNNVPHSSMVAEGIGYVFLSTFTRDAGQNVANALRTLKAEHPEIKGYVLDLRDNGGGLLDEAVKLTNVFVPKGELVVSTKGKVPEWDRSFRTTDAPFDTETPLVVLINPRSASASEIVSGSIQDLDRGLLVGQRSYGKGLVQNQKEIGYNARIKLTTAKYYIPSGRCIQSSRYKNGEPVDIPDVERAIFKTRNGRTVLDGGGVKPDILIPIDTATGIVRDLLEQNVIFNYATEWKLKQPTIDSSEAFRFLDWDGFVRFVQQSGFRYETQVEQQLARLREAADNDGLSIQNELNALKSSVEVYKSGALEAHRGRIIREIEQEIVGRYYFEKGKVRKKLVDDPYIAEAIRLLNDPASYRAILSGR